VVLRVCVRALGDPAGLAIAEGPDPPARKRRVRVRVTHASLGSTDVLARRGGYLLQPRPGFTTGYDLVGTVEATTADAAARGLDVGARVAAVLPRMGAHASVLDLPARLLVRVPDALASPEAAALPLDLVTAAFARRAAGRLPANARLLVQGATGPVGGLIVQSAIAEGLRVFGTSSSRHRAAVEALGATWIDYSGHDPGITLLERPEFAGGALLDAAVDHTGAAWLRRPVARSGVVVRIAYTGRRGRERADTLRGSCATLARWFGHPRERLVSVPLLVATRPAQVRAALAEGLDRVARRALHGLPIETVPVRDVAMAHARMESGAASGRKLVLIL
jgi:NADPH:quinone reductase